MKQHAVVSIMIISCYSWPLLFALYSRLYISALIMQISMSVLPIMEDVLVPVLTLLAATIVLVPLVVHWALMVMPVMVSSVMIIWYFSVY